eukprot:768534-Hanusia_phi.AAC.5
MESRRSCIRSKSTRSCQVVAPHLSCLSLAELETPSASLKNLHGDERRISGDASRRRKDQRGRKNAAAAAAAAAACVCADDDDDDEEEDDDEDERRLT